MATAAPVGCPVSGVYYEISERKTLEARLPALNETLEARIAELREEARTLEVLNRTGTALAAELSLERLVQTVTDAAVDLTRAQFGAFFYNVIDENGEAYSPYSLSGAPREAFANFPVPRNTAVFDPTFRGESAWSVRTTSLPILATGRTHLMRGCLRDTCRSAAIWRYLSSPARAR
jgi:hypothetical protein